MVFFTTLDKERAEEILKLLDAQEKPVKMKFLNKNIKGTPRQIRRSIDYLKENKKIRLKSDLNLQLLYSTI